VPEPDPSRETPNPDASEPPAAAPFWPETPPDPRSETSLDLAPPPSPVPPSSRRLTRVEALAEMVLCSSIPSQLAITWLLARTGWSPLDGRGQLQLGFVATLSLLDTAVLVGLMTFLMRSRGERPSTLWLGERPILREALAGVFHVPGVFLLASALLLTIRVVTPQLHNVEVNPFEALAGSSLQDAAILTLVAIVAGGVREELQRAFLLDRFVRAWGPPWVAVALLSIAFGLGHLLQGRDAAVATGAMGAYWAVVYLRRGSSIAPIVSHALFNTLEVVSIFAMDR
jgi:membrane protease YdiL (CAAX protease family)